MRMSQSASDVVDLDPSNFDNVVLDPAKDVLVEFYAPCTCVCCPCTGTHTPHEHTCTHTQTHTLLIWLHSIHNNNVINIICLQRDFLVFIIAIKSG